MHVYLLDGMGWNDIVRYLCRRLHHVWFDVCCVHECCALQQPRNVNNIKRCQHRMHVYVCDGMDRSDVHHLCCRLHWSDMRHM